MTQYRIIRTWDDEFSPQVNNTGAMWWWIVPAQIRRVIVMSVVRRAVCPTLKEALLLIDDYKNQQSKYYPE